MQLKINNWEKRTEISRKLWISSVCQPWSAVWLRERRIAWHWHPEVELTYIEEGQIEYQVNDTVYCLKAGEGLFCNANALHTGHMLNQGDCRYLSVTFHPRMIYGFEGSAVDKKYVEPVTRNDLLGGLHLVPDTEVAKTGYFYWFKQLWQIMKSFARIWACNLSDTFANMEYIVYKRMERNFARSIGSVQRYWASSKDNYLFAGALSWACDAWSYRRKC